MNIKLTNQFEVKGKIWLYPSEKASWHFITVPKKESGVIRTTFGHLTKGWGSLPVSATLGNTTWDTSIFPDTKSGTYILPLKAVVRTKEGVYVDDSVAITLHIKSKK